MYIQLVLVNGALGHIECHEAHLRLLCHSVKATKQRESKRDVMISCKLTY